MTEAAIVLQLSRTRVHQLIVRGQLGAQRIGRAWVVSQADLDAYLDKKAERRKTYD